MDPLRPVLVMEQFRGIHGELLQLLTSLKPDQWDLPTVCKGWQVRDVAAHLLDGDLRRLMMCRDGIWPPPPAPGGLTAFINGLNAEWVHAARRRLSPRLLIDLIAMAGGQAIQFWDQQDPFAQACFAVSWAGESHSENWFDLAREYTEKWHHQQQIREAVGAPGLTSRYWLGPVLETFVRSLPVAFAGVEADSAGVRIEGEAGGEWTLIRSAGQWRLVPGCESAHVVTTDQDTAWRIFTKGLSRAEASPRVSGETALCNALLAALAIVG